MAILFLKTRRHREKGKKERERVRVGKRKEEGRKRLGKERERSSRKKEKREKRLSFAHTYTYTRSSSTVVGSDSVSTQFTSKVWRGCMYEYILYSLCTPHTTLVGYRRRRGRREKGNSCP